MLWRERLNGDSLTWLLEPDSDNPAVHYFALHDLLDLSTTHPEMIAAQL